MEGKFILLEEKGEVFFTESRRMVDLAGRGMRAYFAERKRMVILL